MATPPPDRVWRPRGVIWTAALFSTVFVVGSIVGWVGLPEAIRSTFSAFQIITLLAILAALVAVMWLLAGSSVRSDAHGLTVRNGWRRHRLAWSAIRSVRLRPGDPWATVELVAETDEGEPRTVMLFGLQGSEGEATRVAVRDLNAHLSAR